MAESLDARRPLLTVPEAQTVFEAMAARGDLIAFRYLHEGCECPAQLMIELLEAMGIHRRRAWALSVGRELVFRSPASPKSTMTWRNHTAPTVAVESVEAGVLVIDPSTQTGAVTLRQWAASMGARSIEISEVPLTQAQILDLQSARVTSGGQPLDSMIFSLDLGRAPLPDVGGNGFRIAADPPDGVSSFSHQRMRDYLEFQNEMRLEEN